MREWNTADDIALMDRAFTALRESKLLEPKVFGCNDSVDLRGLAFPTVTLCRQLELPTVVADRVIGRQEFSDATLQRVDLTDSRLDFSVWNDCRFDHVCFDRASLRQVRFFGCHFDGCTFDSADLTDASFSVGTNGRETEIAYTLFRRAKFGGASCHNPVLRSTSFMNCRLDGFVFEGALCDGLTLSGRYKEITFRGLPNEPSRNRPRIDLAAAELVWLNADDGVDLSDVILPADASCFVVTNRVRVIASLCRRLPDIAGKSGVVLAKFLDGIYSDHAISPLSASQTMLLVSRGMVAELAEVDDAHTIDHLFTTVRAIAESEGSVL